MAVADGEAEEEDAADDDADDDNAWNAAAEGEAMWGPPPQTGVLADESLCTGALRFESLILLFSVRVCKVRHICSLSARHRRASARAACRSRRSQDASDRAARNSASWARYLDSCALMHILKHHGKFPRKSIVFKLYADLLTSLRSGAAPPLDAAPPPRARPQSPSAPPAAAPLPPRSFCCSGE